MRNKSAADKYNLLIDNLLLYMRLHKVLKQDLSEKANINYSQLSRYLNKHNEMPLKVYLELCDALNVSISELEHLDANLPPLKSVMSELSEIKELVKAMSQNEEKK